MERRTYEAVMLGVLIAAAGGAALLRYQRCRPVWHTAGAVPLTGRGALARLDPTPHRLDLNAARADELDAIPGITPAAAAAIVAQRSRRPFTDLAELAALPGIGDRRIEALAGHLYCAPVTNAPPLP